MQRESRAVPKIMGIETEYGCISEHERDYSAKAFLSNIQPEWIPNMPLRLTYDPKDRIKKEFTGVNPKAARDTYRHFHEYHLNEEWTRQYNRMTENGGRLYLDCSRLEYSTPKCRNPHELLLHTRAGHKRIDLFRQKHADEGREFKIYRNNVANAEYKFSPSHPSRVSCGCHLNITVARFVPLESLIEKMVPWFVLQLPISGSGKVGSDLGAPVADFQISQRAEFFEKISGIDTVAIRAWYNTRDVPYANADLYRRIHIIPFDSNMLELPEYLKAGLTALMLMMIEDDFLDDRFAIHRPVNKAYEISWDTSLKTRVWAVNRRKSRSVIDCLKDYCDAFHEYVELYLPQDKIYKDVVTKFAYVLNRLRPKRLHELYGTLDWVTKKMIIEEVLAKRGCGWQSPIAHEIDLKYHDNDHANGFFYKYVDNSSSVLKTTTAEEITEACWTPPPTASRWIFEAVKTYNEHVVSTDIWNKVSFVLEGKTHTLYFANPYAIWNDQKAERLFRLPLAEFLNAAVEEGVATNRMRTLVEAEERYGSLDYCALCLSPGIAHSHNERGQQFLRMIS